jgi:hypothetical protein
MEPNLQNTPVQNTPPVEPQPISQTPPPPPVTNPVAEQEISDKPNGGRSKKMMAILLFVIIFIAVFVLAAVVFGSGMLNKNSEPKMTPMPSEEVVEDMVEEEETGSTSALLEQAPYVDSVVGFSINVPLGWKVQKNPQQGILVSFTNPNDPGNSINVVSESSQGLDLQEYVDVNKEQIQNLLANYTLVDDEEVDLNGQAGYLLGGTFGQDELMVKNRQLYVVANNKAYVVTATSAEDKWPDSEEAMDASMMSLKIN